MFEYNYSIRDRKTKIFVAGGTNSSYEDMLNTAFELIKNCVHDVTLDIFTKELNDE